MEAIHGGKAKNDKIDSYKIASLMRGGNFPLAYNYPSEYRTTRDLLRDEHISCDMVPVSKRTLLTLTVSIT